ncbi:hypothetical protein RFI_10051 [Reticulomyxa filosa]|uniref:NAD(+) kinase n=1 Tax=Reticulomyxa filosa TaxID=46433 RepID=X6NN00_RETFI|nr:hypothetical protein RFI_10051 [Reticulomyxa filosa]|eukprot:ETO27079.1 hypothetical protein RFI_10051 [Reticulomyxa filosa]
MCNEKKKAISLDDPGDGIDFMVCLGGDGTLLHLISLFQSEKTVPPVMVFASGSLGFLTPYDFSNYRKHIKQLLKSNTPHFVTFRLRLEGRIYRFNANKSNMNPNEIEDIDDGDASDSETSTSISTAAFASAIASANAAANAASGTSNNPNSINTTLIRSASLKSRDSPVLTWSVEGSIHRSLHGQIIDELRTPSSIDGILGEEDRSLKFVRTVSIKGMESDQKFQVCLFFTLPFEFPLQEEGRGREGKERGGGKKKTPIFFLFFF